MEAYLAGLSLRTEDGTADGGVSLHGSTAGECVIIYRIAEPEIAFFWRGRSSSRKISATKSKEIAWLLAARLL